MRDWLYASSHPVPHGPGLLLPPQDGFRVTVPVAQSLQHISGLWAEVYAGLGSWSFAAESLGLRITTAVEMDPVAAEAYTLNHPKTPLHCGPVISTAWIPKQGLEGLCGSPPCLAFSRMTGAPGLAYGAASSWKGLAMAGYVLRRTIELANWGPMKRDRLLMIFARRDIFIPAEHEIWIPKGEACSMLGFEAIWPEGFEEPETHISEADRVVHEIPSCAFHYDWFRPTGRSLQSRGATSIAANCRRPTWRNSNCTAR